MRQNITNDTLINEIDLAVRSVESFISNSEINEDYLVHQYKISTVLRKLKAELIDQNSIQEKYLRGFNDICTLVAIRFEDDNYSEAIFRVRDEIKKHYPNLNDLPFLGKEFDDVFTN